MASVARFEDFMCDLLREHIREGLVRLNTSAEPCVVTFALDDEAMSEVDEVVRRQKERTKPKKKDKE